jgi:hypothetical protein
MATARLCRLKDNDPIREGFLQVICGEGIEATLSFPEIGNMIREGKGQKPDQPDAVLFDEMLYVLSEPPRLFAFLGRNDPRPVI